MTMGPGGPMTISATEEVTHGHSLFLSLSLSLLYSVVYREEGGLLGAGIRHTHTHTKGDIWQ